MLSLDFALAEGRRLYMEACYNATRGVFDGCFVDRATSEPHNYDPARLRDYEEGHIQVQLQTQALIDSVKPGRRMP